LGELGLEDDKNHFFTLPVGTITAQPFFVLSLILKIIKPPPQFAKLEKSFLA
jgi:hypothetical protein